MGAIAVLSCLVLLLSLSGTELFVEDINPDELSQMGIDLRD